MRVGLPLVGAGLMQIGEVAERVGLSLRTLRHYEEAGLIRPSARSQGGFRLYSDDDVDRLTVIKRMKPLGFSIEDMRELLAVLDRLDEAPELLGSLQEFHRSAHERCAKLRAELPMAEEFAGQLDRKLAARENS